MISILRYVLWAWLSVSVGVGEPAEGGHHPSLLSISSAIDDSHNADTGSHISSIVKLTLGSPEHETAKGIQRAVTVLDGSAQGIIHLTQENPPTGTTRIEGQITNLSPGLHGFHIHTLGDLSEGCASAGGHYNPFMENHGSSEHHEGHVGDMGNIEADQSGTAFINITDPLVSLVGPRSVVGRAIVVHADEDDLGTGGDSGSLQTGNAGGRIACGVIGWA